MSRVDKKLPKDWEIKKLCNVCSIRLKKSQVKSILNDSDMVSFIPFL
jgi:hypothetical protein